MDREAAIALCREKALKETTVRHLISVEEVMRALAVWFGEDEDLWALTGFFHDLDQDQTGDDGAGHAELAASWLREAGVDERIVNGVLAHAYERYRTDLMSKAVVHADAVAFAPGVNRQEILDVEGSIGLTLDEFLEVAIAGLQQVAPEIDL